MAKVISWIVNDKYAYLGTAANDWTPTIRDTELPEAQVSELSYYWLQNNNKQNYRDAYKKLYDAVNGIYTNLNPYGSDLSGADVYWDVLSQKGVMVISGKDGKNNDDPETPYYNLHNLNQNVAIGLGGDYMLDVDVTARTEFYIERNGIVRNNDVTNIRVIGADNYKSGLTENTITLDIKVPKNTSFAASPHNKQYTIIVECNGGSFTAQTYFTVTGVKDGAEGAYFNLIVFPKIVKKVETGGTVDYSDDYIDVSYTSNESSEGLSIKYKSAGGIGDFIDIPDVWKTGGIPASEVDAMEDSVMILGLFHGNQMIDTDTCTVTKDGRDADSHAVVELDNEMDGVSLGDDNVLNANISIGSGARLWSGRSEALVTTVILKDITHVDPAVVDCSVKSGNRWITDTFNPSTKEAIFDGIVATNKAEFRINFKDGYVFDNYRETITVELRGTINGDPVSAETNYIVVGVKGGKDGEVFRIMPSDDFVSYDPNISQYSDDTLRFDAYIGLEQIVFGDVKYEQYEPYYSVNHTYSTYDELINAQGVVTGNTNEYDFDETQPGIKSVTLYLVYKDDNNERFIIDRETVPVVWNGLNGSDRIYLEIEDEIDPVSLGGDYTLDTPTEFETSFVLYSGGTGVSFDKIEIEVSDHSLDGVFISGRTDNGELVPAEIIEGVAVFGDIHANGGHGEIALTIGGEDDKKVDFDGDHKKRLTITVWSGDSRYSSIYTILGIKEGEDGVVYSLMPSVNAVVFDPNKELFSPNIVKCEAYSGPKKIEDRLIDPESKYLLTYTINTASTIETSTAQTEELTINGVNVERIYHDGVEIERIFFYLFYEYEDNKWIMLDRESIPIVDDGLNASERVYLEIEDEIDPVSLGGDYVLNTNTHFNTSFVLYSGATPITFEKFKIEVLNDTELNGVDVSAKTNNELFAHVTISNSEALFNDLPEGTKSVEIDFDMGGDDSSGEHKKINFGGDHKKHIKITAYRKEESTNIEREYSADYILLGIKEGADGVTYEAMPTANSIVYDPNKKTYSPEAINCDAYSNNKKVVDKRGDPASKFYLAYTVNTAITNEESTVGTIRLNDDGINIPTLESQYGTLERVYFYLFYEYEPESFIMFDKESVPIVSDGTNAAERVFLEVEDEVDPVSLGGDYILNNETPFDTSFVLYSGITAISFNTLEISINDSTLNGQWCSITAGTETGSAKFVHVGGGKYQVSFTGLTGNQGRGSLHMLLGGSDNEISFEDNNHKKTFKITAKITVDDAEKSYSSNYVLLGIRDGDDGTTYSLRPSANSAVYDPNVGKYSPPSISCEAFMDSTKIIDHSIRSDSKFYITYTLNNPVINDDDKDSTIDLPLEGINLLQAGGTELKRIYFYLYYHYWYEDEQRWIWVQLDRESVPILTNGEDGEDGKDADDRIYLELDNEMDGISIGGDDKLDEYVTVEIPLSLYSGSTEINFDKLEIEADTVISENLNPNFINYECVITNNDEEPVTKHFDANSTVTYEHIGLRKVNVKIKLEPGLTFGEGSRRIVTFKATYLTEIFTTKYTIIGLQRGEDGVVYKVLPLDNEVRYDPNTKQFFPSALSCQAYEGVRIIKPSEEDFSVRYKIGEEPPANYADSTGYTGAIEMKTGITRVYFCLYTKFGNDWLLLDRESVPVIKEGLNAQNRIYLELDEETTGIGLGGDSQLDLNPASYPDGFLPIEIDFHLFSGKTSLGMKYIEVNGPVSFNTYGCRCRLKYNTSSGAEMNNETNWKNFDNDGDAEFEFTDTAAVDCKLILCIKDKYNFGADNNKEVKITVSEDGNAPFYASKYTIVGVRDGADGAVYKLIPDANTIIYDPNTKAYDPMDLGCDAYYGGEKVDAERNDKFDGDVTKPYVVAYTVNNPYNGNNPGTSGPSPSGLNILGIDPETGEWAKLNLPTLSSDLKRIYFYLYMLDRVNDRYLKVDAESIPVAHDGLDAETVGYLELDNEMDGIGLKNREGEDYILDNGATVKVPFCIYSGLTKLSITKFQIEISDPDIVGCKCKLENESGTVIPGTSEKTFAESGNKVSVVFNTLSIAGKAVAVITLKEGLSFETIRTKKFTFTAFHNSENYSAFYSVVGVPGGADGESFRLVASVNSVVFDQSKPAGQQYDPTSIKCSAFTGVEQITGCYAGQDPQTFAITVNKGSSLPSYTSSKLLDGENGITINSKDRVYFQLWYQYETGNWMMIDSESVPVLTEGKQGIRGAAMRGPYNWDDVIKSETSMWFCNGEENEYSGSSRFIDILLKDDTYYLCTTTYEHPAESGDNWNSVKGNWTTADTQYNFVAANVILGEKGNIKFMSNNEIYLMDQNNRITGGAKGGTGSDIIFWAGETNNGENLGSAPFRVYANGDLYASTGTFAGSVRVPYKEITSLDTTNGYCGKGFVAGNNPYLNFSKWPTSITDVAFTVRGWNGAEVTTSISISYGMYLPKPISGLNGFTYRIIVDPRLRYGDSPTLVLSILSDNSSTPTYQLHDYTHPMGQLSGYYSTVAFYGGYLEITCIKNEFKSKWEWAITNCTGQIDCFDTVNYQSTNYYNAFLGSFCNINSFSQKNVKYPIRYITVDDIPVISNDRDMFIPMM